MAEHPRASPRPPDDSAPLEREKTPPYGIPNNNYVKNQAHLAAWRAGWLAGLGGVAVAIGIAFGLWFKVEAMAAEKDVRVLEDAGTATDKKLAPLLTDMALVKQKLDATQADVDDLKEAAKKNADQQAEIIRLLKKRNKDEDR